LVSDCTVHYLQYNGFTQHHWVSTVKHWENETSITVISGKVFPKMGYYCTITTNISVMHNKEIHFNYLWGFIIIIPRTLLDSVIDILCYQSCHMATSL
jgi:hypothetical protein